MKNEVMESCYKTSDKIIIILDGLGFASERKPSYENEVRDLIAIEVRRNINDVVTAFYNSVAVTPLPEVETEITTGAPETKEECCGGGCGCE